MTARPSAARPGRHQVTFAVLTLGVVAFGLLQSLVVPVLTTVRSELHASPTAGGWILTAYLLSASIATPVLGRAGDQVGKKRVLVATLVALALGSALAALAPSIGMMIAGRVIQGLGGGVLPVAFGILRDEFPASRVAAAVGALAAMTAVGAGAGTVGKRPDELPPGAALQHLRQMMAQTGVLPERHEDLERVPAWLEHFLADKPVEHANLVRPFLHWHLLRRARSRAGKRAFSTTVSRDPRRRILVALDLLAWIDIQETTLDDLQQDDLDRWLDEENTQRRNRIRYFLSWTADRGLSRRLIVPSIPRQEPSDLLDDDKRWQFLQRCLTDETLPIQAGLPARSSSSSPCKPSESGTSPPTNSRRREMAPT